MDKERGQILYYRPYPEEIYRKHLSWLSIILRAVLIVLIIQSLYVIIGRAEENQCWALCKPRDHVNLREEPRKDSKSVGWLECGDSFYTDGIIKNGWLHVLDVGECDCWIYAGYVSFEAPVYVDEQYVCVAKKWVACRRWVNGPQIKGRRGWLHNGTNVNVHYIAGDWAVTDRGYIRSEWLEVDPV